MLITFGRTDIRAASGTHERRTARKHYASDRTALRWRRHTCKKEEKGIGDGGGEYGDDDDDDGDGDGDGVGVGVGVGSTWYLHYLGKFEVSD